MRLDQRWYIGYALGGPNPKHIDRDTHCVKIHITYEYVLIYQIVELI